MKLSNKIFSFLILYLSFFLFSLQLWLDRYFGTVDIEQFLFFPLLIKYFKKLTYCPIKYGKTRRQLEDREIN